MQAELGMDGLIIVGVSHLLEPHQRMGSNEMCVSLHRAYLGRRADVGGPMVLSACLFKKLHSALSPKA